MSSELDVDVVDEIVDVGVVEGVDSFVDVADDVLGGDVDTVVVVDGAPTEWSSPSQAVAATMTSEAASRKERGDRLIGWALSFPGTGDRGDSNVEGLVVVG